MNQSKRAILAGAADVIEQIRKDEAQDLRDQPDQIENSASCQVFRNNIINLEAAVSIIRRVITRSPADNEDLG